eukprot:2965755-Karenia_brevis.AAC.1
MNAFGRMLRSRALKSVREHCPDLFPMLCGQWRNARVVAWQRVDGRWVPYDSWRGGWQGSRLTQITFCIDLLCAFDGAPMFQSQR